MCTTVHNTAGEVKRIYIIVIFMLFVRSYVIIIPCLYAHAQFDFTSV